MVWFLVFPMFQSLICVLGRWTCKFLAIHVQVPKFMIFMCGCVPSRQTNNESTTMSYNSKLKGNIKFEQDLHQNWMSTIVQIRLITNWVKLAIRFRDQHINKSSSCNRSLVHPSVSPKILAKKIGFISNLCFQLCVCVCVCVFVFLISYVCFMCVWRTIFN
jgi:hypothetical protein